jgi:hypothetical protein
MVRWSVVWEGEVSAAEGKGSEGGRTIMSSAKPSGFEGRSEGGVSRG